MKFAVSALKIFSGLLLGLVMIQAFSEKAIAQNLDSLSDSTSSDPTSETQVEQKTEPPAPERRTVWSGYTEILSKYVGMDGAIFWNYPLQQSQLAVTFPNSLSLGVWTSEALNHRDLPTKIYGNEVDVFADYSPSLGKGWTGNVGVTYIDISPLNRVINGDVMQFRIGLDKKIPVGRATLDPYARFRYFTPTKGVTPGRGFISQVGVGYHQSFTKHVDVGGFVEGSLDNGAFGFGRAFLFRSDFQPGLQYGKVKLGADIWVTTPMTHVNDGRKFQFVVGPIISVTW